MYAYETYKKAKLILDKSCIGSIYNLRFSYRNYKFKAEAFNCLLCDIDDSYACFLTEGLRKTFDLYDKDIVLYAKKVL
jgi:predicted GTPase